MPKPIYGIDSEKEPLTLDGFEIERPSFEKREEEFEKMPMDFAPHGNNNMTMVPGFEILLDCNNRVLELKKEDITWVPTDWVDHMDLDAMTTLLGDHIYNIEEEEYWEACRHTLKSPYRLRAHNEDEEKGAAPSDDENGSEDKSDSSSDNNSSDGGNDDDDSSTNSEPPNDREDEDADLFYEEYDSDVDCYDQDIEDDAEANRWNDTDSDQYRLVNVLENAREENAQANQISGPRYDKHGREVPELGSYYDSEPSSPTTYTKEEDDIDAILATLDHKLMVHGLRIMTLENAECSNEEKGGEPEHLPKPTDLGNGSKHDLLDEWMDSIERLDAFVTDKPINMEVEEETTDYMDVDPAVLMLRGEGAY
ncbi:hypothetical protein SO802_023311 [Lithocarpus litseifolius]|uniref:Uncharacterized protein n=1 Tax=Lithocarpus litseifolius TaxID=425828 RepID=A0AAW2C6N2_9ROSI